MNQPTLDEFQTKLKCGNCQKRVIVNMRTTKCPNCGMEFNEQQVQQQVHYVYESTYNNKFTKAGNVMTSAGKGMQQMGNGMSSCGCGIFIIALVIFILLLLLS